MSGENAELKNEIVRLAKKYGFVTPYTSFLAADDKDLVSGNRPIPLRMNLQMSLPANGVAVAGPVPEEAVAASKALREMKSASVAVSLAQVGSRHVGSKTFRNKDGAWIDTTYDPSAKVPVIDLVFGSEALLKAIAKDSRLASYAALGQIVTVAHNGKVYRIHP